MDELVSVLEVYRTQLVKDQMMYILKSHIEYHATVSKLYIYIYTLLYIYSTPIHNYILAPTYSSNVPLSLSISISLYSV